LSPIANSSTIPDNFGTPLPQNCLHSQRENSNPQGAKSSTKRLFSNRESTALREDFKNAQSLLVSGYVPQSKINQNGCERSNEIETEEGSETHIEKRHRTSDWPLKSSIDRRDVSQNPNPHIRHSNSSTPPLLDRKVSKFIEGSMNNRASKKPPSSYVGDENEVWEQYENEQRDSIQSRMGTQPSDLTHHANRSAVLLSRAERPHSGIFRFGKSLAATLNPSNWRIWSKSQDEEVTQRETLKEQQEKAGKIYNGMPQAECLRESTSKLSSVDTEEGICARSEDDSGVGFGDAPCDTMAASITPESGDTSRREKRYGKVFLDTPGLSSHRFSRSPVSETPSFPREPSAHLKKPSLPNLESSYTSGNIKHSLQSNSLPSDQGFRRIPSRMDLRKQQKLVKRVSDLEGKLEAARRQLSEALGEPVPVQPLIPSRKRFTPNALTTLPSERILSAYTTSKAANGDEQALDGIGRAVSTNERSGIAKEQHKYEPEATGADPYLSLDPATSGTGKLPVEPMLMENQGVKAPDLEAVETPQQNEIRPEHNCTMATNRRLTRKRKGINIRLGDDSGGYKPSANSQSESDEFETQSSIPETKPGRPRKLQKVDPQETACRKEIKSTKNDTPSNPYLLCKNETIAVPSKNGQIPKMGLQTASLQLSSIASNTYVPAATTMDRKALQGEHCETAYGVEPPGNAPPVPKLPRNIRLATGELVSLEASMKPLDGRTDKAASLEDARKSHIEDSPRKLDTIQKEGSFEWPADVF
jgi:hypothetical protein